MTELDTTTVKKLRESYIEYHWISIYQDPMYFQAGPSEAGCRKIAGDEFDEIVKEAK